MKKAIVAGLSSLLMMMLLFAMPVLAEEDDSLEDNNSGVIIDEEETGDETTDEDNQEGDAPELIDLGKLYGEGKLIAEYTDSFVYTGTKIKPEIRLYMLNENETGEENKIPVKAKDYTVEYAANKNVGDEAKIIVKANEGTEYCGEFTVCFSITSKPLEEAKCKLSFSSTSYTGKNITPAVTVELDGKKLVNKQDYSVSYSRNKEIGTATVTVTGKGNYAGSKKLTFKIVMGVPKLSTVPAYNKITVKWGKIAGATKYVLERSTSKTSGFKKITEIKKGSTVKYVDKNVKLGKTYYYRIRAYKDSSKSSYSTVVSQKVQPAKAEITKVARASYNSLKVTWKKVSGATRYAVYRSTSEKGKYERIAVIKKASTLSYTDKKLVCGKTYYYKVAAYRKSNGKNYYGSKSAFVSAKTTPAKINFTKSTSSDDTKVKLCWKQSKGAAGYTIYRSTKKSSGYIEVKDIAKAKTVKWTDSGLDENVVYYYKIRPYAMVNNVKIYGAYSSVLKKELISEKEKSLTKYTKVPYRWGGASTSGWDCSGFTQWAMEYLYGIEIEKSSASQAAGGKAVSKTNRSKWQFGDILVYSSGGRVNHVALYIGNNQIMHALNSKVDTVIHDVDYYEKWDKKNNLKCVRRYR